MRMPHRPLVLGSLVLASSLSAFGQPVSVTYHPNWYDMWTSGSHETHHSNQPISFTPDCTSFSQCPRYSGYGHGMFRYAGLLYHFFQGHDKSQVVESPGWVGDHIDSLQRRDSDGFYERIPDFFALPPFSQLDTQWDTSVYPLNTPLPRNGTAWQVGSGFAPIVGPPLAADPPGSTRFYYFFAPESKFDHGYGGHLLGFASQAATAALSLPVAWSSVWRDTSSRNDGTFRLSNNLPLRTLHLSNFTPVLKFRADPDISGSTQEGARVFGGLAGWYDGGWFYLLTSTLLSVDSTQNCNPVYYPTKPSLGLLMIRVKHDPTRNDSGGLALDSSRRPIIEILASSYPGGPMAFQPLPNSDEPLSFSDDDKPWLCTSPSRLSYAGCCSNPAFSASRTLLTFPDDPGFTGLPSNVFLSQNGRDRYVVLSSNSPQAGDYRFRLLRVSRTGLSSPYFAFSSGGEWSHADPAGYRVSANYYAALPNVTTLTSGSLIGFRTAEKDVPGEEGAFGQFAFTADFQSDSLSLYTVTPCRVVDTRDYGAPPIGGPALGAGERRVVLLGGACGIPLSARAVTFNVTVVSPSQDGSLTLAPGDVENTNASTISFRASRTRGNNGIVSLGGAGSLAMKSSLTSGSVHVIIDVNGYFK